jgi:hypothetical protein
MSAFKFFGEYDVWCISPSGKLQWHENIRNAVTDVALTAMLEGYFRGGTVGANWYLSLVNASGFDSFAASDTMASHAGWTEFTSYANATRPAWGHGAAAGKIMQNATLVTFTMNGSGTLQGLFTANENTKGGATGTLWATAPFSAARAVVSGNQLPVRYRVIAAAG